MPLTADNDSPRKKTDRLRSNSKRPDDIEGEFEALFSSIGEGVVATDAEGRISRINQVALNILGCSVEDVMGIWYPEAIIAEDKNGNLLPNIDRPIAQAFLSAEPVAARIYYRRKDGSSVPVALSVSPVLLDNKPIGAVEVFRDITQELALEKAKDDFISIASHQLRTPATGVKQYLGMTLEGYAETLKPQQRNLLNQAYKSNERQLKVIEDLLNVARIDAGNINLNIQKNNIIKLIKDVVEEQAFRIKSRGLILTFSHPQRSLSLQIDAARIRMVMENLLDNAIKYTPEGKKIEIRAYKIENQAVIEFFDQGVGIDRGDQDKLFQKFQRIPNSLSVEAGGTGLGLYWANEIVKLHGGHIAIKSSVSRGSRFAVYLPLRQPKNRTYK